MSSSLAATVAAPSNPTSVHAPASLLGGGRSVAPGAATAGTSSPAAQFREIHKNTWLKRLTAEGKKITVGPKKSDRSWVVFCVHDDTEALLEGYAEPRQAASHSPEWVVSMQDTLHISHALIPNSHEFEFVVTLNSEVVRFHAMSWEIMQEWVETLRSKLREMKILSPRENLYTKLPEIRAPLLPTRDPTSPLPAPPLVPAALVPGTELVSGSIIQSVPEGDAIAAGETSESHVGRSAIGTTTTPSTSCDVFANNANGPTNFVAMSNTLTQNLLNMLSDPISTYSDHINGASNDPNTSDDPDNSSSNQDSGLDDIHDDLLSPVLRKANAQILAGTIAGGATAAADNSVRVDVVASGSRLPADHLKNLSDLMHCDPLIPRYVYK